MTGHTHVPQDPIHCSTLSPRPVEPLPPEIRSIQPGGGFCMRCELAWGWLRRWYLRHVRPGYVGRMRQVRLGTGGTYPHEILDPRDLKFYRNQGDLAWREEDDRFAWRGRLGFVRVGWAEIMILGGALLVVAAIACWLYWPVAVVPLGSGSGTWMPASRSGRSTPCRMRSTTGPSTWGAHLVDRSLFAKDPSWPNPTVTVGIGAMPTRRSASLKTRPMLCWCVTRRPLRPAPGRG